MRSLAFLTTALLSSVLVAQADTSYRDNPDFTKKWREARQEAARRNYAGAIDAYARAYKISNNQCVECIKESFRLRVGTADYKGALKDAAVLEASTDTKIKAEGEIDHAVVLVKKDGDHHKPATLAEADQFLKAALADEPGNLEAMYHDGKILAELNRTADASAMFRSYLEHTSRRDAMRTRVEHFVEDPKLSLRPMAPAFALTTLDGRRFDLDKMGGRVVLIDFWATWCGPCNEELPHIKKLAQKFANDPFVVISISWDKDEQKWQDFIAKNEMTWPQYRDSGNRLSSLFNIHAIPHYFTIDSDGVLQAENVGSGSDIDGRIRKLIAKAKADAARTSD